MNKKTYVILAFIFSIIVPPVGFVLAMYIWWRSRRWGQNQDGLTVAAIIIGAVLSVILVPIILVFSVISDIGNYFSGPNPAEEVYSKIDTELTSIGGVKLCANGNNGKGIDNTTAWYEVYYSFSDSEKLDSEIEEVIRGAGYETSVSPTPGDEDTFRSFESGPNKLEYYISREKEVALYCGVEELWQEPPG